MTALELLAHHAPDQLVAFGGAGEKTASDLLADAARISAGLPEPTDGSHILLMLEDDRYAIAASLLGILHRGHAVALPPNMRRDSILALHDRPETVAAVHDSEAGIPFRIDELLDQGKAARPLSAPFTSSAKCMATVFTSGTTGPIQGWPKGCDELLGEAHMLARVFGIRPGDRIVGTVAAGHIYGLLFTVLLPLASGAAFSRETPHHAEAIAQCVLRNEASVLVTVPVGLRAFAALAPHAFPTIRRVFSSTGPLPASVASDFRERHDHTVTEILGSTETGGIAWRERCGGTPDHDERWTPLEGVVLSTVGTKDEERRLRVDSPFIHSELPVLSSRSGGRHCEDRWAPRLGSRSRREYSSTSRGRGCCRRRDSRRGRTRPPACCRGRAGGL
jgi:acyl-coenzyme A synthetase/AMP-(fatty) acid ligase